MTADRVPPDRFPADRYVALLRGVNVGRHRRMRMADLRAALTAAGDLEVATVLQSGNVVLTRTGTTPDGAARHVRSVISDASGHDVEVVVRTAAELAAVVAMSPDPAPADGSRFVVAFLSAPAAGLGTPDLPPGSRERWWPVTGREVYVDCADGLQDSPVMTWFGRQVPRDVTVTVRNWNTVTALAALL